MSVNSVIRLNEISADIVQDGKSTWRISVMLLEKSNISVTSLALFITLGINGRRLVCKEREEIFEGKDPELGSDIRLFDKSKFVTCVRKEILGMAVN